MKVFGFVAALILGAARGSTQASPSQIVNLDQPWGQVTSAVDVEGRLVFAIFKLVGPSFADFASTLWASDGSAAGTAPISDDLLQAPVAGMVKLGGRAYFAASERTSPARRLWTSDGTAAGTYDLQLAGDVEPARLTPFNGELLYIAGSASQRHLHIYAPGSSTAANLTANLPAQLSDIRAPTAAVGLAYFVATTPSRTAELWKTDGTDAGTVFVAALDAEPRGLRAIGRTLYFSSSEPNTGRELWRSDGTNAGTRLVADIYPGIASSSPSDLTAVDGCLYFSARDRWRGRELWHTDGTEAGTVMVADIAASGSSDPRSLTAAGRWLYFTAVESTSGRELWRTDGTDATRLTDIEPGPGGRIDWVCAVDDSKLYLRANTSQTGAELWRITDGANATEYDLLPGVNSSWPGAVIRSGAKLMFFTAGGPTLWSVDPGALRRTIGLGCGAPAGATPQLTASTPRINRQMLIRVGRAPARRSGILWVGHPVCTPRFAKSTCEFYVNMNARPLAIPFTTTSAGTWNLLQTLPAGLAGQTIAHQADLTYPWTRPFVTHLTNGLHLVPGG